MTADHQAESRSDIDQAEGRSDIEQDHTGNNHCKLKTASQCNILNIKLCLVSLDIFIGRVVKKSLSSGGIL